MLFKSAIIIAILMKIKDASLKRFDKTVKQCEIV